MSVRIMADVFDHYDGPAVRKLVLLCIADYANDDGTCWPLIDTIARRANLQRRQTFEHVAALKHEGWLKSQKRKEQASIYTVLTSVSAVQRTYVGAPERTQNRKEIVKNSITSKEKDLNSEAFDKFWEAYPRKADKAYARKAFAKAVKKIDLDSLLAAVDLYSRYIKRERIEKAFIKLPSSWLNGERWDDDLGMPPPKPVGPKCAYCNDSRMTPPDSEGVSVSCPFCGGD